jgi:pimeloyl-ACP methyl ester carboxylesterase
VAIAVPAASARSHDDIVFFQSVGPAGANGAYVVGSSTPTAVVVFLHGWRDVGTGPYYNWLQYLAFSGDTVIFPRHQAAAGGSPAQTLPALRSGIEAGLATLRKKDLPLIVVGYDYGARLAFYYAANAVRWRLPAPSAIDSVFPSAAPVGLPAMGAIPDATRVLLQVEPDERAAGADLWSRLAKHPAAFKRYRVIPAAGGHRAPLVDTRATQIAFWLSLDALIGQATPTG